MATNHTYRTGTYNGILLHMLRTHASNITLKNLRCEKTLKESGYYGCNGGFFNFPNSATNPKRVISLAKVNGGVVGPNSNDGNQNNYTGGGVILWNGNSLVCLFSRPDDDASTMPNTSAYGTWAQGGISFWLGYKDFYNAAINEVGYKPDQMVERSTAKRTAMIADLDTDNVYLIATENECDYIDFRAAIQSAFDITDGNSTNSRYKGIMLDGGGSTQFRANRSNGADVTIVQSRKLAEVIVLRNSN